MKKTHKQIKESVEKYLDDCKEAFHNTKRVHELRIIIAGGRTFKDYEKLSVETSRIIKTLLEAYGCEEKNVRIVSGHASGADQLGERFAIDSGFDLTIFPANWLRYGKAAGCIRNETMADYATDGYYMGTLIAFWNGKSRGAKHMIETAENAAMDVIIISYED